MNRLAVVLGVAAVATLAGCKDPEYARNKPAPQDEAKSVETEPAAVQQKAEAVKPAEVKPVEIEVREEAPKCRCAPGTRHAKPCECGAADCQCIVEAKAVEPEYTTYIVQRGDYLAKISKRFNIRVDAIKRLNNMKGDNVRLGQKLKLPGRVEVGEQKVPAGAIKSAPAKKGYASYKGEVVDYTVKAGDSLGKIAYSNGMNIRQLKELNGLRKDTVYVGQKLKIAANGKSAAAKPTAKPAAKAVEKAKSEPAKAATVPVEPAQPAAVQSEPAQSEPAQGESAAPAPAANPGDAVPADDKGGSAESAPAAAAAASGAATDYVVQEGDDLPNIAIEFQVPVARLRELNNLGEGDEVKAGQVLKIPAAQ